MGNELDRSKKSISGFSKLTKSGKIKWIVENFFRDPESVMRELMSFWHPDEKDQKILDEISENTISNFHLPFGVAPNYLIDDKLYAIPMVIEESSVVAAAASAGKYWMNRGGFKTRIISTIKVGQVHFKCKGNIQILRDQFEQLKIRLLRDASPITKKMEKRGGGVLDIELMDFTDKEPDYYQLFVKFETCDSMGANFINTVLEQFANSLTAFIETNDSILEELTDFEILMSILSNYNPDCIVEARVSCPIEEIGGIPEEMTKKDFARRFCTAVRIAAIDPYRAVTHNKGIYNGIDAVVLATGNDFRAIEASGHAYASNSGQYRSLSYCKVDENIFTFWLQIPLALGTVGGLTNLHPMAKRSLELLGNPSASELMSIIASVGLAQNFSALKSLVTVGIQKGHMKMHLLNILKQMNTTEKETKSALDFFKNKIVSFSSVRDFIDAERKEKANI